jgi:two-component system sensor histidine kinase ChvG
VDSAVLAVRISILGLFALALALTVLVSLYLARTIANPILRLAGAAALMREGRARTQALPEKITDRNDEIGTLARALDGSAKALWARMDAIERFAADVSHEIKNPLSSIRSAIETLTRVEDPTRASRLLAIITQDVARLDRLITDISDSSRLDSELSRTTLEIVDLAPILETLKEIHDATRAETGPRMVLDTPGIGLTVRGVESRLVQVLRNLIGNAISFSPPNGFIWLRGRETGGIVELSVEDEGPGIPDGKLDGIFDRFYSERPESETFGSHSGLGLSISRQIVEAHQGRIAAENRRDASGDVIGARFVIRLPKADA